jgi:aminoglycoside phosphotransferase (APT) family kinase protein
LRESALVDLAHMHEAFAGDPILTDHRLRDVGGRELPALRERSTELASELDLPEPLRLLAAAPEQLLIHLADTTTLVHGDAWPGNVLPLRDGGHCWIDWEEAGRGHPALDLANWLYGSPWVPEAPDPDRDLATYLAAQTNTIDEVQFRHAIAAAVILLFLLLDLPSLATWERAARSQIIDKLAAAAGTLIR